MADSKDPENSRAPVRKRLPRDADWKLKTLVGGRARLSISRCRWERMERMRRACGVGIGVQRGEVPVSRVWNSLEASTGSGGRRWLKRVRMGAWVGGMRRTSLPTAFELVRGKEQSLVDKFWKWHGIISREMLMKPGGWVEEYCQ